MVADDLSLAGKVAIVTGSGRENGIGAAIATTLARNGAWVTINHVSEASSARAAAVAKAINEEGGGKAIVVGADIGTIEGAKHLSNETMKGFGVDHIDILVNNAAIVIFTPTLEATQEEITEIYRVNVFGPIYLAQAIVPHMPKGGRIINITSVAPKLGLSKATIYASTKAAFDNLTWTWSREFGRTHGITVNSIAVGFVPTDMAASVPNLEKMGDLLIRATRAEKRAGSADEVADAVLLVASPKSRWITGQVISASGGISG